MCHLRPGSIDALEELKAIALGDGFRPPVLSSDIYHVIPHVAIQEGFMHLATQLRMQFLSYWFSRYSRWGLVCLSVSTRVCLALG